MAKTYKEFTVKELKEEYRGLYQAIYQIGCYGSHDLQMLDAVAGELERRDVEISMTPQFN